MFQTNRAMPIINLPQSCLIVKIISSNFLCYAICITFASFYSHNNEYYICMNYLTMSTEFERQKKVKASAITFGVAGALLLLFILIKWPLPSIPEIPVEEFIEVNLGNSDFGSGKDQPLLPGEPAPAEQTAYTPPTPVQSQADDAKDVETNDRADNDAPEIKRPSISKPNATKIDNDNKAIKTTPNPTPVVTQAPPRPKATMGQVRGGNGNGGNGAETYKAGTGEGVAGGNGDQGRPGGNPNGGNYSGTPKNFGVRVLNIPNQSFEDDFNENAKVAVDIVVTANGKIASTALQPRGTTTNNRNIINIALRRARELKMGETDGGQKGTVIFSFKVRG